MALALICIFASLLVFIILTETLTIYISRNENISVIEIHLIVFALRFTKTKNNTSRRKRKNNDKKSLFLRSILPRIIKNSEVTVENLEISLPSLNESPYQSALRQGIYSSLISSLFAFAENNARFFDIRNIKILNSEHNNSKASLDLKIKISLLDAVICYVFHIAESTFRKKGRKYYVRKQNE